MGSHHSDDCTTMADECNSNTAMEYTCSNNNITDCYIGIQSISMEHLKQPDGIFKEYRVRDTNEQRVRELANLLQGNNAAPILVVLKKSAETYIILDGNHRFNAIVQLNKEGHIGFHYLQCQVYEGLTVHQSLSLGFSENRKSENNLRMDDFDKVHVIRRVLTSISKSEDNLEHIYKMLSINVVRMKRYKIL